MPADKRRPIDPATIDWDAERARRQPSPSPEGAAMGPSHRNPRSAWWSRVNPTVVVVSGLMCAAMVFVIARQERVVEVEKRVEVPGPERVVERIVEVEAESDGALSEDERTALYLEGYSHAWNKFATLYESSVGRAILEQSRAGTPMPLVAEAVGNLAVLVRVENEVVIKEQFPLEGERLVEFARTVLAPIRAGIEFDVPPERLRSYVKEVETLRRRAREEARPGR